MYANSQHVACPTFTHVPSQPDWIGIFYNTPPLVEWMDSAVNFTVRIVGIASLFKKNLWRGRIENCG